MIVTVVKGPTGLWHRFKITDSIDPPLNRMYCNTKFKDDELIARYQFDSPVELIKSVVYSSVDSLWCDKCKFSVGEDYMVEHQGQDEVNHPAHYGGADNPYEAIKVIEAWELGFNLGNAIKYVSRAGKKDVSARATLTDLQKAAWYLNREIELRQK